MTGTAPERELPKGAWGKFLYLLNYAQDGQQNGSFILWLILIPSTLFTTLQVSHLYPVWLPYWAFFAGTIFFGVPILALLGWVLQRATHFFAIGQVITTLSSPFQLWMLTPKEKIIWGAVMLALDPDANPSARKAALEQVREMFRRNGADL